MRYRRHLAGLAAGVMLAVGTGTVSALAGVTGRHPLAPEGASARLGPADVYLHDPRGVGSRAVVVTGGDPGNGNGPKAIVIGDPGGDGPGPKVLMRH